MTAASGHRNPSSTTLSAASNADAASHLAPAMPISDSRLPLLNLSALAHRIGSIRRYLSDAVDRRTSLPDDHLALISQQLGTAAQEIILNAAALLASAHPLNPSTSTADPAAPPPPSPKFEQPSADLRGCDVASADPAAEEGAAEDDEDCEIVEVDEAELMAEHVHFCEICGKGFKRDANLRMHMRAHGNQYKTLEALSKPDRDRTAVAAGGEGAAGRKVRFSCPFVGCNRNRGHKKFRPMKSVVCVKNHFKRSHCPKMYSCHRCNKKNFSVLADLRNHIKHCGESRWRCSCGTTFSRKDKLFGHIALFDGHMPVVGGSEEEGNKKGVVLRKEEEGKGKGHGIAESALNVESFSSQFFKEMVEEFDEIERGDWMSS